MPCEYLKKEFCHGTHTASRGLSAGKACMTMMMDEASQAMFFYKIQVLEDVICLQLEQMYSAVSRPEEWSLCGGGGMRNFVVT